MFYEQIFIRKFATSAYLIILKSNMEMRIMAKNLTNPLFLLLHLTVKRCHTDHYKPGRGYGA